jgi:hypothetical protein
MAIHGTVRGQSWSGRIDLPQDNFTESANGERVVTRVYRTLKVSWLAESPKRGSAHPVYPDAKLESLSAKSATPAYLVDVTLTYRRPGSDESGGSTPEPGAELPASRYSETVSEGTANIEEHPDFATFGTAANGAIFDDKLKFQGWQASSPYAGRLTFETGSVTRSTTTYHWGTPASVSTVLNDVDGNWRVSSGSIQREGIYWSRTINEKYNPNGWPAPIY